MKLRIIGIMPDGSRKAYVWHDLFIKKQALWIENISKALRSVGAVTVWEEWS